jgi:tetratricopeptide (TPR) repeat protein
MQPVCYRTQAIALEMAEETETVIYAATPIWARMVGWVLLGVGGIVLLPIAAIRGDEWLLVFAIPLILAGLALFALRLHIALISPAALIRVTNSVLGLRVRQRQYSGSEITGLDLQRIAGDDRERASDTWYLRLRLEDRTYTIGKYDSRTSALLARRDTEEFLQALPPAAVQDEIPTTDGAEPRPTSRHDAAQDYYRTGLALFSAGDKEGARPEFEKALALAQEPLLRRMIEQRLEELERR